MVVVVVPIRILLPSSNGVFRILTGFNKMEKIFLGGTR